jgi:hypothetical protein
MAENDLAQTLEDPDSGTPYTLIDPSGVEFPVIGTFGDVGFLLNPDTGLPVEGRSITAAYRMKTLAELTADIPSKGWKAKARDLSGKEYVLYIVRYEPDRTMGIGRITLAVNYE